jgi:Flp pilus assembly protein CpaB
MAQQNSRAKQQRRQIIIVLFVLLLLGLGAFYSMSGKQDRQQRAGIERPEGLVAVPVLKQNLRLGERISTLSFRLSYMPPAEVPPNAILNTKQFVGRFATQPLLAGNYIRNTDVAQSGASGGYSGLASAGKRLVVLDGASLPGAASTLRIGDHVDLLAIGEPTGVVAANGGKRALSAADSPNSVSGGGIMPGDKNSNASARARARLSSANVSGGVSNAAATLVAENAIVMRTPVIGVNTNFLVLEMEPQDAHVTMLMLTAGATMRFVFRPFNDEIRHTAPEPIKVTTRIPRPVADPDAVTIISGNVRANAIPNSKRYAASDRLIDTTNAEAMMSGNPMFSDTNGMLAKKQTPNPEPAADSDY